MSKRTRLLLYGILLLFCLQGKSRASFRYAGYIQQYILSDPLYSNPEVSDWRKDYWVLGSSLNPTNSIAGWGGTRVSFQTCFGSPSSPFYLEFPLLFYSRAVQRGSNQLIMSSTNFALKIQSGLLKFSMSSKRIAENTQWSFISFDDPLGALKLPNTANPMLTVKLTGAILGWNLTSYYLADNRCNFLPRTEEIPDRVFDVLGETKEKMRFFDETPTYRMVRGTKDTHFGTWGFLWGEKRAVNINPRHEEYDSTLPYPNHGVGYVKQNVGIDYVGSSSFLGGKVTAAAVKSVGDWYKYRQHLNEPPDNLGKISGDAVKFKLSGLKIKSTTISSSYVMVEPGFQWIAVRDSRYAYVLGYRDPNNSYLSAWRAMRDDDFLLRDSRNKEQYLSDVSTYLGLRAWDTVVSIPGKISISEDKSVPVTFSLELKNMINLTDGDHYYDPVKEVECIKDYRQLKTNLKIQNQQSKTLLSGLQRKYKDYDYLQELSTSFTRNLTNKTDFFTGFNISKRLRADDALPEGNVFSFNANLIGEMNSGLSYSTGLDYRTGNYDYGLFEATEDHVLTSPYTYWEFNQYLEQSKSLNLGRIPIRTTVAAEIIKRNSTIDQIEGTSFVAFGRGIANITPDLTATVTLVNGFGPKATPQKDKFPSNSLYDTVDCLLNYNLFGKSTSNIFFRFTRRIMDFETNDNLYARFTSRIGANTLSLIFGRPPIGGRTPYIAGTKYDVRLDNPEGELIERPWATWGSNGILSDKTYPYILLVWTMRF